MHEEDYRRPWYITAFLEALKTAPNRIELWVYLGREILKVHDITLEELADYFQIPEYDRAAFFDAISEK